MKKFVCSFIAFVLILSMAAAVPASGAAISGFVPVQSLKAGQFRDVDTGAWYYTYVETAYNYGIFSGKAPDVFDPNGNITLGEAVKIASVINSIYLYNSAGFNEGVPFYEVYAAYANEHGIIDGKLDYTKAATRAEMAELLCRALPESEYKAIRDIPDGSIFDVFSDDPKSQAIYTLYRAGIFSGSDDYGTFNQKTNITRAEVCAAVSRIIVTELRSPVWKPLTFPSAELYARCADAVLTITTYDKDGDVIRDGSGFFISESGLAVTTQHVLENAAKAVVTLHDGSKLDILGVNAYNVEYDLAVFSVKGSGFSRLALGDSDKILTGSTLYAIGSPLSLSGSISEGVVSHTVRPYDGKLFFQFTAPISFGSGGGPVIDTNGRVIGVASSSFNSAQNINLAIPSNLIKELEIGGLRALTFFTKAS